MYDEVLCRLNTKIHDNKQKYHEYKNYIYWLADNNLLRIEHYILLKAYIPKRFQRINRNLRSYKIIIPLGKLVFNKKVYFLYNLKTKKLNNMLIKYKNRIDSYNKLYKLLRNNKKIKSNTKLYSIYNNIKKEIKHDSTK